MARFIVYRLLRALVTLFVFQTILFLLIQVMPGDFVSGLLGLNPAMRHAMRRILGLEAPLWQQYLRWMGQFFSGNLGITLQWPHQSVGQMLLSVTPRTLLLFLPAATASLALGFWLGKHLGWRRRGWLEGTITVGAIAGYTSFAPWLAFVLVQVFALRLRLFPGENVVDQRAWAGVAVMADTVIIWMLLAALGLELGYLALAWLTRYRSHRTWWRAIGSLALMIGAALGWYLSGYARQSLDILWHLTLPLATLVLLSCGETMLLMRVTMQDYRHEDHVLLATAKGLPAHVVRDRHVARLALLPVMARFVIQLPFVLLGSVIVERAFFWRGVGHILFQAVDIQDIPVIMGILSIVGVVMVLTHVTLDILQAWLDPRVRSTTLSFGRR